MMPTRTSVNPKTASGDAIGDVGAADERRAAAEREAWTRATTGAGQESMASSIR